MTSISTASPALSSPRADGPSDPLESMPKRYPKPEHHHDVDPSWQKLLAPFTRADTKTATFGSHNRGGDCHRRGNSSRAG